MASATAHGVAHYDVPLSAKRAVSPEGMAQLVALMRGAPKPLLVHCKSGADRTGLVAALYHYAVEGKSAFDAAAELSLPGPMEIGLLLRVSRSAQPVGSGAVGEGQVM